MSEGLRKFETLWQRLRGPNELLRPRLVAWLREVVPPTNAVRVGDGPPVALSAWVINADYGDGWQVRLTFHRVSEHDFAIAPVVPVEPTQADYDLLGLEGPYQTFVHTAWLYEVFGEAWVEAGMAARGIPFAIFGSGEYRGPGGRMKWKEMLRGMAFRATAPLPPGVEQRSNRQDDLVAPPHPLSLPDTPAALQEACRAGEPDAPLAWAASLEAAGDRASADLLRWTHGFADTLLPGVAAWAGHGAFWIFSQADKTWWGQGESGTDPGDNGYEANRLADLLQGWNVYHPAFEWLLRRAGLTTVKIGSAYFANGSKSRNRKVNLGADKHLAPLDEFSGVTEIWADPSAKRR